MEMASPFPLRLEEGQAMVIYIAMHGGWVVGGSNRSSGRKIN